MQANAMASEESSGAQIYLHRGPPRDESIRLISVVLSAAMQVEPEKPQ